MKKILFILFCTALIVSCTGVSAADAEGVKVSYAFGEIPASVKAGETVAVPLYLTITGSPVNSVITHLSFNEEVFAFQKYKSSTDKGTHGLNIGIVGATQSDSSVISAVFVSSDGNSTCEFNNTLLYKLRFTVLEDAKPGGYEFKIVKSQTGCDAVGSEAFLTEEYSAQSLKITVSGNGGIRGDADGNGKISVADACVILKHISGIETLSDTTCIELDGDGAVTVSDAMKLLKYIARLINELQYYIKEINL